MKPFRRRGFTLLELMIVVAIIGSLAAIAIPKFADMVTKAQEASTKGGLGAIRSSIMIYYAGLEGRWPGSLAALTVAAKYINAIPISRRPPFHPDSNLEVSGSAFAGGCAQMLETGRGADPTSGLGWCYDNQTGAAHVYCVHADSKGVIWTRI